ncbi:MAG TPA: hypothetical protein VJ385_13130, partial [Fibrobacteria bacterium]|nr:hypothetical protein [Fibrobacteria bacterium]
TLILPDAMLHASTELEKHVRRLDEFLEGAKWVLEREAEKGRLVSQDPPIYALAMEAGAHHPRLALFYTIAYDKVLLLSISAGNPPAEASLGAPGFGPEGARY